MTRDQVETTLSRIQSWPFERRAQLAELVELLEAQQSDLAVADDSTRAAVAEGLAQARRGEFATDEEVVRAFNRFQR